MIAHDCMAQVRELLSHPRPPGNWWAHEVIEQASIGKRVTTAALELAEAALSKAGSRAPGEDDE